MKRLILMRVLHLSDTPLSGSPIRISTLLAKHKALDSRHMVWSPARDQRVFDVDLVGSLMTRDDIRYWIYEWADVVHYHNRWRRQQVFQLLQSEPPKKPSVIQIHSPRHSTENFEGEARSGLPIAVIAQYHVRQWPEARYIVPNVVDIWHQAYYRNYHNFNVERPTISYSPSNCNGRNWDDKGYNIVNPILKKLRLEGRINYQFIYQKPHRDVMALKKTADAGIDDIITGSYHLSSLEYLALGVPCFANLDDKTEAVVKEITGATSLPWLKANKNNFASALRHLMQTKNYHALGLESRLWMEKYWNPEFLVRRYVDMYNDLCITWG